MAAFAPAQAEAGGTASVTGGVLTYNGSVSGDNILIQFQRIGPPEFPLPYYTVNALDGGTVTAGTGCTQAGSDEARCLALPPGQITSIVANGDSGNDTITIGSQALAPSILNATLRGGRDKDVLTDGAGNDVLLDEDDPACPAGGPASNDELWAGAGNDTLIACLGSDTLDGGPGNDVLKDTAFDASDGLSGGDGNDEIWSRDLSDDGPNCGAGTDTLKRDNLDTEGTDCELFYPLGTTIPTITGTVREGSTITSSQGIWKDQPTSFAYAWSRCVLTPGPGGEDMVVCTPIGGATSASYTLVAADVGGFVKVTVTGSNSLGSDTLERATAGVAAQPPQNVTLPAITGSPVPGSVLSATNGVWATTARPITGFAYQWRRCAPDGSACSDVLGATTSSYLVTTAELGASLRVQVTATNVAGSTAVVSPHRLVTPPPGTTDTTAPNTTLVRKPKAKVTSRKATFAFRSNEAGSTFECKLDRGAWRACVSPRTVKKLKLGKHIFYVRARDAAGNIDATPAKRGFRVVRAR
jgi:hemolysin type calcium-binding protein